MAISEEKALFPEAIRNKPVFIHRKGSRDYVTVSDEGDTAYGCEITDTMLANISAYYDCISRPQADAVIIDEGTLKVYRFENGQFRELK